MEMCGRICSILSLFIPVCNYNFENLLTSLNIIYERINTDLGKKNILMLSDVLFDLKLILYFRSLYNYGVAIII